MHLFQLFGERTDAFRSDDLLRLVVDVVENRKEPLPESLACGGEVYQLVAAVRRILAAADVALALEVAEQIAQTRLVLDDSLGERLLSDALVASQAAEHLQHLEGDADAVLFQRALNVAAECHAGTYDEQL